MDDAKEEKKEPVGLPSAEVLREIERKQEERAKEIRDRRLREVQTKLDAESEARDSAATVIQRNYRGHRERRALKGYGLDPSTRWLEAVKDAEYHNLTRPLSKIEPGSKPAARSSRVRERWAHASSIAKRAGSDDTSESEADTASQIERKKQEKRQREKYAKTMGLEYFLEMVDQKHRYGSNLRRYHQEWKKSDTTENFFYWLDYGDGKELDLEDRPRKRLDTECVRYLSREERRHYLVRIDDQGRFVWDKNRKPITTSPDFRDSIEGIVYKSDDTPTWREVTTGEKPPPTRDDASDSSSLSTTISTGSHQKSTAYANEELHDAKGVNKLNHLGVDTLMNHLLRKTTKSNTWIFVADTSFRLYVGIKQSGAFQHSSFLKGARVSAAGLIKIKRGQIRKLSPLSGHYAPPVRNFREFVKSLKAANADLSRLNISRSYAVILGLEGYMKVKKRGKDAKRGFVEMWNPEEKKKREEAEKDKSQSAEKERQVLKKEEEERMKRRTSYRLMKKMGLMEEEEQQQQQQQQQQQEGVRGGGEKAGRKSLVEGMKRPSMAEKQKIPEEVGEEDRQEG
ncbi:IQ domain-containing IQM4-like [Lecanosticta acicola]|uniref:IQ domain-containing IQM4-like n=1 Tax=Lecanosticta acicola TaxID=111012 RepID=A0AAI9ECT0_9PEZI|nr:IQ domain-containing IQM4-like [Lecanosticta acicola]